MPAKNPVVRIVRNIVGVLLILLGIAGLVLPILQGFLFLAIGIGLVDLPIKRRAHRWLVQRVGWYRRFAHAYGRQMSKWRLRRQERRARKEAERAQKAGLPAPVRRPRVASLLPSATEIVGALGLDHLLVGVSHECDWPPRVQHLAVLTHGRAHGRDSAAIDRSVRHLVEQAASVFEVEADLLRLAAPDVVLTQDLCEVCAVTVEDVRHAMRAWVGGEVRMVSLRPQRLADVFADIEHVAAELGAPQAAAPLVQRLQARIDAVRARVRDLQRPRVLTLEWIDPPLAGGLWTPELVELAGGTCLVAVAGEPAPRLLSEQLPELAPDVVVVKPCGYDLHETLREQEGLRQLLASLGGTAADEGRTYVVDGNAYFNRSGPRLVDSLELLAACLHPGCFPEFEQQYREGFRLWR